MLRFVLDLLGDYGHTEFYSNCPKDRKFVGSDEAWEEATNVLAGWAPNPAWTWCRTGGAAFWAESRCRSRTRWAAPGGRPSAGSTSQSGSSWSTAADGTRQRPVMIHCPVRSIERFFGILTSTTRGRSRRGWRPIR
jgi:threonyl-tRNA synthetase